MSYANEFRSAFYNRLIQYPGAFTQAQVELLSGFALAQAKYESANFSSNVFVMNNNPIGYKYYSGSIWQTFNGTRSPEGDAYASYTNVGHAACELADWINRRKGYFSDVETLSDYVHAMKQNGYFGDSESTYLNGVAAYYNGSPGTLTSVLGLKEGTSSAPFILLAVAIGLILLKLLAGLFSKK